MKSDLLSIADFDMQDSPSTLNENPPAPGSAPPSPSDLQRQMAEDSPEIHYTDDARIRKVRSIFSKLPPGRKMLDVGCCDGFVLQPFVGTHEVHGVDIKPEWVRRANRNGFKARVHNIDQGPLPYENGQFDAVLSGETLEHTVDTDWALHEINRVMKIGGTLVVTLPNVRTPVSLGMMILLGLPPRYSARYRAPHFRDFTLKVGRIALENNGFKVLKITGGNMHIPGLGYTASWLASLCPGWAETIIYHAVKQAESRYSLKETAKSDIYGLG